MLYNTDWLAPGKMFPPASECVRLRDYEDEKRLFDCDSTEVYRDVIKSAYREFLASKEKLSERFGSWVEVNYFRLNSLATADLLCGEMPVITVPDERQEEVDDMLRRWGWAGKLYAGAVDVSRFGDCVFRPYYADGAARKTKLAQYTPGTCYKIMSEEDESEIKAIVRCVVRNEGDAEKPYWVLHAQIFEPGKVTARAFRLEEEVGNANGWIDPATNRNLAGVKRWKIKGEIVPEGKSAETATGTDGIAVTVLGQVYTSDRCWGRSDYDVMDSIMAEIWKRVGQISVVLDANAAPDMYGDISNIDQNRITGECRLKGGGIGGGNFYVTTPEAPNPPGYITWDGSLQAAYRELEILFSQLYKVTEMGAVFEASAGGSNIAYETMKAAFVRPLSKVRRIANGMEDGIRKLIATGCKMEGIDVSESDITITWCDGLPNDEKQEIDKATAKINAGLSTAEKENVARFGMTAEDAADLAEAVKAERATAAASMYGGFGFGGDNDDGGGEDE